MVALKLQRIGDEIGLTLPREMLAALKAGEGDVVYLSETPQGVVISAQDDQQGRQLDLARDIMARRRGVLRVLAQ
ncbi:hypothetical protein [Elstera cyanobacteriorum]|uniref:AbrB/MazE/SpoVT family DNA-binding domain-containing protein n=1 Tax=Elstera cyanobacteriorum TaxID=2022747 RepID=A0A255XVR4_9PROT|nr:hypothetical protein [Elstera cyanobacteriorum]OYQ21013.1 hypothetical protein CHR90_03085 [Elstera cyanobacteriorum]